METEDDMVAKLAGAVVMAALLTGCSIRIQAPIREVAYDFSDHDFYDRAYAPSPVYAPTQTMANWAPERPLPAVSISIR
jgi:hypothetical protein